MKKGDWVYWKVASDRIWAHVELYQPSREKFFSDICFTLDYSKEMRVYLDREAHPIYREYTRRQTIMDSEERRELFKAFFEAEDIVLR